MGPPTGSGRGIPQSVPRGRATPHPPPTGRRCNHATRRHGASKADSAVLCRAWAGVSPDPFVPRPSTKLVDEIQRLQESENGQSAGDGPSSETGDGILGASDGQSEAEQDELEAQQYLRWGRALELMTHDVARLPHGALGLDAVNAAAAAVAADAADGDGGGRPTATSPPPLPFVDDRGAELMAPLDAGVLSSDPALRPVPVYVMLPLDTVWLEEEDGTQLGTLWSEGESPAHQEASLARHRAHLRDKRVHSYVRRVRGLEVGLQALKAVGVEGVMVDVWWGLVEREEPGRYDWEGYRALFEIVRKAGLKTQVVMSFHAAGGNVGDTCSVPLPTWVLAIGAEDPDVFFTDRSGVRNQECLTIGIDDVPLLHGRTAVECYRDCMEGFRDAFEDLLGSTIVELTVGMGSAGELRYPAYPEGAGRWRFPGVGEFQCYDKYLLADLTRAAEAAGRPEWGHGGPHDAGHYNSRAYETGFFADEGGSWATPYGDFFLTWYSDALLKHAERMLGAASEVFARRAGPMEVREVRELREGGGAGAGWRPGRQVLTGPSGLSSPSTDPTPTLTTMPAASSRSVPSSDLGSSSLASTGGSRVPATLLSSLLATTTPAPATDTAAFSNCSKNMRPASTSRASRCATPTMLLTRPMPVAVLRGCWSRCSSCPLSTAWPLAAKMPSSGTTAGRLTPSSTHHSIGRHKRAT